MAKRSKGIFDPDYRYHPWNKSKYAPKNNNGAGNAMTQTALAIAGLFFCGTATPSYMLFNESMGQNSFYVIMICVMISSVVFIWAGKRVRRVEKRRLLKLYGDPNEQLIETPLKPATQTHRPSTTPTKPTLPITASHAGSPREFEHEIAWLFNVLTPYKAVVSGGAGDGGADVRILDHSGKLVGIAQCKRYDPTKPLAPMYLREVHSVKIQTGVQHAWLATTARFSPDVEKEAAKLGIELMDGAKIQRMKKKAASKARVQGL